MYHHLIAWSRTAAGAETDIAATLAPDEVLTLRNGNLILSDPSELVAVYNSGAVLTRARMGNPTNRKRGTPYFWQLVTAAAVPTNPQVLDYSQNPIKLSPNDEEITNQITQSGIGTAQSVWWLRFGPGKPQPSGERLTTRFTAVVVAGTEATWTPLADPVFTEPLEGGAWAVRAAYLVAPAAVAFRLAFRVGPMFRGRRLRPGGLVQNASGNYANCKFHEGLGCWGYFSTFEPPQLQVFGDAAGGTYEGMLDLTRIGDSRDSIPLV